MNQALHEALMKQEELLEYMDRREQAKLSVSLYRFFLSKHSKYDLPGLILLFLCRRRGGAVRISCTEEATAFC